MSATRAFPLLASVVAAASAALLVLACGAQEMDAKTAAAARAPSDPAGLQQVAETCARIASCMHSPELPRLRDPSACVDWWFAHAESSAPDPLHKCLAQATTCAQIATCTRGGGDARAASFCAQRPGVVSGCDGDRLITCGDDETPESVVTECSALGGSCREAKASGGLVIRACFAPQKCPADAPDSRCDGEGAVLSCHNGAIERETCRTGTRCRDRKDDNGEQTASCELSGMRGCDRLGARHCEGDRLVECASHDRFSKVRVSDCAGFGLRCTGTGPRAGCYVPTEVECDRELLPKCADAGKSLVFCAAGRLAKLSCTALGMGPCGPTGRGAVVACSPGAAPAAAAVTNN